MSAADAVVAGAAAAGLCGTSGRLEEHSAMKPEGQTECILILSNMTASTPLNVGARAKLCARGKSREAKFYFLRLSCYLLLCGRFFHSGTAQLGASS